MEAERPIITPEEIASVTQLDAYDRYEYFIKRIADQEVVYVLEDAEGNWPVTEAEDEETGELLSMLPVWSAPEFAAILCTGEWAAYKPEPIDLDVFAEQSLPQLAEDGFIIDVFPVTEEPGFIVDADELLRDIADELEENY